MDPKPRFKTPWLNRCYAIYAKFAPPAVMDPNAANHWQEKMFYILLLVGVTIGFVALILSTLDNIRKTYWLVTIASISGYTGSILLLAFRRLPYTLRASIACTLAYFLGISLVLDIGPFLVSREYLFSFSIMASVLLGWPGALTSIATNLATWLMIGILIKAGYWENLLHLKDALFYWNMIAIDLLFINICTTVLITLFFIRIAKSDQATKTISQLLLSEGEKLTETNQQLESEIEDRKIVAAALRKSEEKYRTILETIEDAYFEIDLDGNLAFFNRAMRQSLGYSDQELYGMNYRRFTDKANAEKLEEMCQAVFTTKNPSPLVDLEFVAKNRGVKTVSLLISLKFDNYGLAIGFQCLVRDITEYKLMEARLRRAQKMEAIGTLAGGVAHDLNNILSGIVSYPELILLDMADDAPMKQPLFTIKNSGERAVAIVQDLLTLARRGVTVKEAVNLNAIIQECLESNEFKRLQSFHPGVRFGTHLDNGLLNMIGAPTQLSKALMNLVSNAAEAIEDNGKVIISTQNKQIQATLGAYSEMQEGEYVVLTILDTGDGIAPGDLDKIFEPFFTKKEMGRSGTGLGMAVVWGTVQDHGGHIDVQSTPGQGTIFTLYFPATRQIMIKEPPALSMEQYKGKGETILVVDDTETQRVVATAILKRLGYNVATVNSGEEAIEFLKIRPVDLMLLDMIMQPGIDGLETYQRIIAIRPDQKTIIVSGFSETERVKEAQRLGAGAYVRKPYFIETLGTAIKKELCGEQWRRAAGS
ncbi:MAG: ATP-binding protein [Desulfobacteraceae bacterium]|nr:ATP-binding protein [Desulfobacteraceae bacterium]